MVDYKELFLHEVAPACKQYWKYEFSTQNQKTPCLSALVFSSAMCHHQILQMILQYFMEVTFPELSPFPYSFSELFLYDPALIWKPQKMDLEIKLGFTISDQSTSTSSAWQTAFLFRNPVINLISSRTSWFMLSLWSTLISKPILKSWSQPTFLPSIWLPDIPAFLYHLILHPFFRPYLQLFKIILNIHPIFQHLCSQSSFI